MMGGVGRVKPASLQAPQAELWKLSVWLLRVKQA